MDKAKLFSEAEKSIVKGNLDKALESLEVILRKDHNDVKALNKSADVFLKTGHIDKAVEYLRRVGEIYTREGFFSKAIAIYKRVLKLDHEVSKSEMIVIHEKLAELYGQLGLVSDSMNHFSIVVDFYDQNNDRSALLDVLRKVADLDPYNMDNQFRLVDLFIAEDQKMEAAETLSRIKENAHAKGASSEVIRVLEKWVSSFPEDIPALQELVTTYVDSGEPKRALAKIQTAFRADPYNPEVLELLSSTFDTLHQTDKAKAVRVELIKIYRQKGESSKATQLETLIKSKSNISTALPEEEQMRLQQKKVTGMTLVSEDALDPAESLIKEMPLSNEERKILSECEVYLKYGLLDKAEEVLRSQLKNFSKSLSIRWRLKSVCNELGKKEDSAHLLSEIIMLGEELNQTSWVGIARSELITLDPSHVSVETSSSKDEPTLLSKPEVKGATADAAEDLIPDFDDSEISIVLDDDEALDEDISLFGETADQPMPQMMEETKEAEPEIEVQEDILELIEETSSEVSLEADVSKPLELELSEDATVAGLEDSKSEAILTEDDFSEAELMELGTQLESEPSEPTITLDLEMSESIEEESLEAPPKSSSLSPSDTDIDFELKQGLEEVQFFKDQGLNDEATQLISSLKERFSNHPHWSGKPVEEKVKKSQAVVSGLSANAKVTVQEDDREDGDFFDLGREIDQELAAEEQGDAKPAEFQDVFNAFKEGVKSSVKDTDFQTHFDLGTAYREMGLIDDAIEEFTLCKQVRGKESLSLYQLGICEVKRENWKKARNYFDEGLKAPSIEAQEKISLSYELAEVLLKLEDKKRAIELLEEVKQLDPNFREVEERIKQVAS